MKNRVLTFAVLWLAWLSTSNQLLAQQTTSSTPFQGNNEYQLLMEKIRQDFATNPPVKKIDEALKTYNETDGSFTDVDYASIQRTNWPPLKHIERLYDCAFAYTIPGNCYYNDESLYNKIVKGLEFWYERNPWCHNWWYNQIAEPQQLGVMLIQLRTGKKLIPSDLEKKTLERIKKDGGNPAKWTGANRTDIALHWIYRACLTEDEEDLTFALDNAYNPIVYTTKEGFQHDNCYFQHGRQLYIGGYGDEILKGITQVAMYTHGTRYAIPQEKLKLLSKFMRETYYATIRGKHMLFDVLGRGVSRPNITDKSHTALFAKRMMTLDPNHADEFKAIVARLESKQTAGYALKAKHTHYFRGDYTLHVRPEYTFDVRMVSTRTARCEYGNEENLKTYFMSDGCTNITTSGDEYANIFPVWNWTRIPGITAPQMDEIPQAESDWQQPGTSTFAGGVSDSLYGVSAYAYNDNYAHINTTAHKSWFFFDDEVVCLGAGITSTSDYKLSTTLNQCLTSADKTVWIKSGKKTHEMNGTQAEHNAPEWVLHNGIGYLFPQGGAITVSKQTQSGDWNAINHSHKGLESKEVFTLSLEHGENPTNASYAYIVVPGKDNARKMESYSKQNSVEIISNTAEMQVVRNKQLNIWGIVFYQAGELKHHDLQVKADKACTLLVKTDKSGKATLHVADPGQTESEIRLDIKLPKHSKKGQSVICDFKGSGIYAGSTKAFDLQF